MESTNEEGQCLEGGHPNGWRPSSQRAGLTALMCHASREARLSRFRDVDDAEATMSIGGGSIVIHAR